MHYLARGAVIHVKQASKHGVKGGVVFEISIILPESFCKVE